MARQCRSKRKFLLKDFKCQGVSGHAGDHWCYNKQGTLVQWINKTQKKTSALFKDRHKSVLSITPPDAPAYISPTIKIKEYWGKIVINERLKKLKFLKKLKKR